MRIMRRLLAAVSICAVLLFFVFPVRADFRNTPIEALIPFTCVKADVSGGGIYDFVIEAADETTPMPESSMITIKGSGSASFGIEIDEPGTYQYKLYEMAGSNKKIIYDSTTYTVTLFVTQDDDGILDYQIIPSKGGLVKPSEIKFVNKASGSGGAVIATGEKLSAFVPYAFAAFGSGCVILILALRRRKEEADV